MQSIIKPSAFRKTAEIFQTISHPTALHILQSLETHTECSTRSLETSTMSINAIRTHLNKLISFGIVRRESMGSEVYYKLTNGRIERLSAIASELQSAGN